MMKRALPVLLMFALLPGCSMLSSTTSTVGGWFSSSKAKNVPQPTALQAFTASAKIERAWSLGVGDAAAGFAPAEQNGMLYAASTVGKVARVDLQSGREIWKADLDRKLSAGVGVGQGLVVVGSQDGEVIALSVDKGDKRWEVRVSSTVAGPPQISNGLVLVRTGDGRIHALNAADGSSKWLYSRQLPPLSLKVGEPMLIKDDVIYAGFAGGKLIALAVDNGAQLWESTVALPRGATELERITDVVGRPVADARKVCAVAYQGRVACFDRQNGNTVWAKDISSDRGLAMGLQQIYVTAEDGAVVAFDAETGRINWRQDQLLRRGVSAPLVVDPGVVVVDAEGWLHLLNRADGGFRARTKGEGEIVAAPVDIGPGFVVQTRKGELDAYKLN